MTDGTASLVRAWQALRAKQAYIDERVRDAAPGATLVEAAADLVAYGLAGHNLDTEEVPSELAALLAARNSFDDATWEQQPSYEYALETIADLLGASASQHAQELLVELLLSAARLGPGLGVSERYQIAQLRSWLPEKDSSFILLIHGMSQQDKNQQELSSTWNRHLRTAFERAELAEADLHNARLAYYADLMDGQSSAQQPLARHLLGMLLDNLSGRRSIITDVLPTSGLQHSLQDRFDVLEPAVHVARDLVRSRSEFTVMRDTLRKHPLLAVANPPPQAPSTSRIPSRARLARDLGSLSPTLRAFVVQRLTEVWLYLTRPAFREHVQQRIDGTLAGAVPSVIIGHSLGSVVAMDHLLRQQQPVPALITLGSPLWMPTVLERLLYWHAGRPPLDVGCWVNLYDGRDVVGGGHPMARTWGADGPTDEAVSNTEGPLHHGIRHYLSHPSVARTIHAVTASSASA